jgi:hypothetical protein
MSTNTSSPEFGLFPAGNRDAWRPGERMEISVLWALPATPARLEARLFWYTRGKGTEDVGLVASEQLQADGPAGERTVRFMLPAGPYSFSGKLISLIWAIELIAQPGNRVARCEFTLSPDGREILLHTSDDAART